jgi:hypothetical protein
MALGKNLEDQLRAFLGKRHITQLVDLC